MSKEIESPPVHGHKLIEAPGASTSEEDPTLEANVKALKSIMSDSDEAVRRRNDDVKKAAGVMAAVSALLYYCYDKNMSGSPETDVHVGVKAMVLDNAKKGIMAKCGCGIDYPMGWRCSACGDYANFDDT
jgi:hypothetical protein